MEHGIAGTSGLGGADEWNGSPFIELGSSGLKRFSGYVYEEFLKELQGARGAAVYREMLDNDAIVGSMIFAVEQLCRQVTWTVEPGGSSQDDLIAANLIQTGIEDMSDTWANTLSEILTMLPFGFSFHEIVYKRRCGDNKDPSKRSKYNDGLIGWRKLPIRAQESLFRWDFDAEGGIQAMLQRPAPDYQTRYIPIDKGLLFRPKTWKANPEGRSAIRNAYRSWYLKKNIETLEGIGIERDLAGIPVAWVPPQMLVANAPAAAQQGIAQIKKIVTQLKRDEQEGIVFPLQYDEHGHKMYDLTLLSTGGRRQFDTNAIIQRYDQRIAGTILADLILIGQGPAGSFALMDSKVKLFEKALDGWLDGISEVFNRHAIPRLLALNGMKLTRAPQLKHGSVTSPSLPDLAAYISALSGAGIRLDDAAVSNFLLSAADMPIEAGGDNSVGKAAERDVMTEATEAAMELMEARLANDAA